LQELGQLSKNNNVQIDMEFDNKKINLQKKEIEKKIKMGKTNDGNKHDIDSVDYKFKNANERNIAVFEKTERKRIKII